MNASLARLFLSKTLKLKKTKPFKPDIILHEINAMKK